MTGNQIKGRGFRGALRYNLEKVGKNVAEVLDSTFARSTEHSILKEVQMIRSLRPKLQKYFYHTSINFPREENLPNEAMKRIGRDYLEANGFTQHQFIMFRHHDADHPHLHILVNRIGYDGKVLSDSNDYQRSEKILRDLEGKYNLKQVNSSREAKERAMTKNELEMMKRTNLPSQKMKLQVILNQVLKSKIRPDTGNFIKSLESKGINVLFNQATTGFVSGISYQIDGFTISGAKLGNDYKWSSIKTQINYEQERDRTRIYEANSRAIATGIKSAKSGKSETGTSTEDDGSLYKGVTGQYSSAKPADQRVKRASHPENRGNQENPKNLNLGALLDGNPLWDLVEPVDQSVSAGDGLKLKKKRKKRRRQK